MDHPPHSLSFRSSSLVGTPLSLLILFSLSRFSWRSWLVSLPVLGDMAFRPNFGLNELDFVFSTLVVGSILNFTLMFLLAPTLSTTAPTLPSIFANSPTSHMFEPGPFTLLHQLGTLVFKGAIFAAVGFAAGLVGTVISNGLLALRRKKMDPNFDTPNKPTPTVLNAVTWALHMGISSNLRYQTLNGIEFLLAWTVSPLVFNPKRPLRRSNLKQGDAGAASP